MEEIQEKLEQYRLRKRRTQKLEEFKRKFKNFLMLGTGASNDDSHSKPDTKIEITNVQANRLAERHSSSSDSDDTEADLVVSSDADDVTPKAETETGNLTDDKESKLLKYILRAVYVMFWITLYVIAIQLKFGIVFLMFSALFGIYFNTRTGPKKRNEISAYSVFNKNCESIDGTLKAEQFEREIRYGSASVR